MVLITALIGLVSLVVVLALYRFMERRERRLGDQGRSPGARPNRQ